MAWYDETSFYHIYPLGLTPFRFGICPCRGAGEERQNLAEIAELR